MFNHYNKSGLIKRSRSSKSYLRTLQIYPAAHLDPLSIDPFRIFRTKEGNDASDIIG